MRFGTLDYRNVTAHLNFYYRNYRYVPFDANITLDGSNSSTGAELSDYTTAYLMYMHDTGDANLYVKGGVSRADIGTIKSKSTVNSQSSELDGIMIGAGVSRERGNGAFFRTEVTYTDYEEVTFNGSLDTDSVRNKIDGDVDALAIRFSIIAALNSYLV